MHKFYLRISQSEAEAVARARDWMNQMILSESRGPGDVNAAMRRLEARDGLPYSLQWRLRYAPPKTISVGNYRHIEHTHALFSARRHAWALAQAQAGMQGRLLLAAE